MAGNLYYFDRLIIFYCGIASGNILNLCQPNKAYIKYR